jgi:hypothetical protein
MLSTPQGQPPVNLKPNGKLYKELVKIAHPSEAFVMPGVLMQNHAGGSSAPVLALVRNPKIAGANSRHPNSHKTAGNPSFHQSFGRRLRMAPSAQRTA